jgi:superfamily I DNA/RNA helicase
MKKQFKPSPYQEAIFRSVAEGKESIIIDAGAGCGKTVTIVRSLQYANPRLSILFLAFNKAIAEELKARVPKNVKAATFHSVGFGAWMSHVGRDRRVSVDSNKLRSIIKSELGEREQGLYGTFINRMVGLGKGMGIGYLMPNDARSWRELAEHFDVNLESEDADEYRAYELCKLVLQHSVELAEQVIDFDDMLYMPLVRNTRFWQYDVVFVDESQDTNQVQLALLKRMIKPGGRLVAVGDPNQAIYGFRGADSQAMDRIREEFGCITLPLSISYRCSKEVVRAAQEYVPHLEWFETAPEGKVEDLPSLPVAELTPDDAILCRNTAPLVETAYALIRQGKACRILGRDIGVGLEVLIKKMNAKGIDKLVEKLEAYQGRETAKLASKGREDKAQAVEDKVQTLMVIIDNLPETGRTVPGLIQAIQDLFSDNGGKGILTLATAHKAKGLEWPRVYILGRHELMPSKWARKAWQKEQEANLIYVAYTRAKLELYFVPAPAKRGSK